MAYAGQAKGDQPPICRMIGAGDHENSQVIVALPAQDKGETSPCRFSARRSMGPKCGMVAVDRTKIETG